MEKYNDMKSDNEWLHRIANECAETNSLLKTLISSLNNPNQEKPKKRDKGSSAV